VYSYSLTNHFIQHKQDLAQFDKDKQTVCISSYPLLFFFADNSSFSKLLQKLSLKDNQIKIVKNDYKQQVLEMGCLCQW
jgi:hypothetical protein